MNKIKEKKKKKKKEKKFILFCLTFTILQGAGYGMATIRVDGNDFFAVYNATRTARNLAISQSKV
jgi:hypothetical protein